MNISAYKMPKGHCLPEENVRTKDGTVYFDREYLNTIFHSFYFRKSYFLLRKVGITNIIVCRNHYYSLRSLKGLYFIDIKQ